MLLNVTTLFAVAIKVIEYTGGFLLPYFFNQDVFSEVEAGLPGHLARRVNSRFPIEVFLAPFVRGADA